MKKIINDPKNIVDEMLKGMVAAHPQYIIENKLGIHARPASEIVKIASKFQSNISLK